MSRRILSLAFLLVCFSTASALPQRAVLDFDGDNKTDYAVVRLPQFVIQSTPWYLQRSTAGFQGQTWGTSGDRYIPADYDGDLKWDFAVWRPGTPANFYILQSQSNTLRVEPFGTTGDDPFSTQDFDGDLKADPTVTRNVGGTTVWYIQRSLLGFIAVSFGNASTDATIRGDFDGDGKADVSVYRRSSGSPANTFFVLRSLDGGIQSSTFGNYSVDTIVPADFDGDGKTDYAVCRVFGGHIWYWLNSSDGSFHAVAFGASGDPPALGDYDGDGKSDQAVWRSGTQGTFYVNRSTLGFVGFQFGTSDDRPLANIIGAR